MMNELNNYPLEIVTDIDRIKPGQAIACEYTAVQGVFGTFANLGKATKDFITEIPPATPDGSFYFICVGYTPGGYLKLVADRNIQSRIAWSSLNLGLCSMSGLDCIIDNVNGRNIRLLGSLSGLQVSEENHGEWDAIISYCDLGGLITPSDDAIWHCKETESWTMTTADLTTRIAKGLQDKGQIPTDQTAYPYGLVNDKIGFRPVLTIKHETRYLYLKEDNSCYKIAKNALFKVADDWTALAKSTKLTLLNTGNVTTGKVGLLKGLGKFKLLFAVAKYEAKPIITTIAVPEPKLLTMKTLINLALFSGINQAALASTTSGQGLCKVIVTTDLKTYKTYDFETLAWSTIDHMDLTVVAANGIDPARLAEITRTDWDALLDGKKGVGFAYLLDEENITDTCEINQLDLIVDTLGSWEKGVRGSDYTYGYPRNNILRVKLLADGDYKINYCAGPEEFIPVNTGEDKINDNVTVKNRTWSSQKIKNELAKKADQKNCYTKEEIDTKFESGAGGGGGSGASAGYKQITKLNVAVPKTVEIPIGSTYTFNLPPVEILKFAPGLQNQVKSICAFDNADADDFMVGGESGELAKYVTFDGTMRLKTEYAIVMGDPVALGDGFMCESEELDFADYKKVEAVK